MLEIDGRAFTPWMLGNRVVGEGYLKRCEPHAAVWFFDIFDPAALDFYRLVNGGNHAAFGDLGMPAWVQLDCCTLPSAMVGLALPRASLDPALFARIAHHVGRVFGAEAEAHLADYDGLVPVSEYCGLATDVPGVTVGFSMFTLLPNLKLGLRAKALALLAYGTEVQLGTTQYDNIALRSHCQLGPLEVVEALAQTHSKPDKTLLYRVHLREPAHLVTLYERGESTPEPHRIDFEIPVTSGADAARAVIALQAAHGRLAIVAPGLRAGAPPTLCVARGAGAPTAPLTS